MSNKIKTVYLIVCSLFFYVVLATSQSFASLHSTGTIIPQFHCVYEGYNTTTHYNSEEVAKYCKTIEENTWFILYEKSPVSDKEFYRGKAKSGSPFSLVPVMGTTTNTNALRIVALQTTVKQQFELEMTKLPSQSISLDQDTTIDLSLPITLWLPEVHVKLESADTSETKKLYRNTLEDLTITANRDGKAVSSLKTDMLGVANFSLLPSTYSFTIEELRPHESISLPVEPVFAGKYEITCNYTQGKTTCSIKNSTDSQTITVDKTIDNYSTSTAIKGITIDSTVRGLTRYVNFFITWLYTIAGSIAVIRIIMIGITLITQKTPEILRATRKKLFKTVTALTLIMTSSLLLSLLLPSYTIQWFW